MALSILNIQQNVKFVSIDFTMETAEDGENVFDILQALTFAHKLPLVYGFPAYQENMFPCGTATLQTLRFEDSRMFHWAKDPAQKNT